MMSRMRITGTRKIFDTGDMHICSAAMHRPRRRDVMRETDDLRQGRWLREMESSGAGQ
jgi:hypothetical protein